MSDENVVSEIHNSSPSCLDGLFALAYVSLEVSHAVVKLPRVVEPVEFHPEYRYLAQNLHPLYVDGSQIKKKNG